MKIVFFGTPEYVLPVLDALHKEIKTGNEGSPIKAVITQAPKPAGRKQELKFSPVDTWAYKKGVVKFFSPDDIIKNNIKADLGILASYGKIIPANVIGFFPHGILNIHPSLLPSWRGSSPVQATIISGDQPGVSIIKIDEKLDHGPIISQFKEDILPEDTTESLRERLFRRSARVLVTLIPAYLAGKITARKQDDSKATYTREIKKPDGFIPFEHLGKALTGPHPVRNIWKIPFMKDYTTHYSPSSIHQFIRAMQPWPGAWTLLRLSATEGQAKRLKILKSHLEKSAINHQLLAIDTVQLEGKNPVSWKQLKAGYPEVKLA
jgi:methionyl-tRNA formyltransferase